MPPSRPLPTRPPTSSATTTQVRSRSPAHLPLHRRLLFPTWPPSKPLPPIVHGAGSSPDIDLLNDRIYYLIALLLRAYVLSWYPSLSKDRTLLPILTTTVILPVLSPILNGLSIDRLVDLVLLDLPCLLTLHITTYSSAANALPIPSVTTATRASDTKSASGGDGIRTREEEQTAAAYHARLPLLCVEQGDTELSPLYLTALADALLALHLPPTEYAVASERIMLREVLGRVVLGGIARRLSQGWFCFTLLLRLLGGRPANVDTEDQTADVESHVSEKGQGDPNTHASATNGAINGTTKSTTNNTTNILSNSIGADNGIVRLVNLVLRLLRTLRTTILWLWATGIALTELVADLPPTSQGPEGPTVHYRVLDGWLTLLRAALDVDGSRSGRKLWRKRLVFGTFELVLNPLQPLFDRLLPHLLATKVLTIQSALRVTDLLEGLLFPLDGYPGATPPDPTAEEATALRKQLEQRIQARLPHFFQVTFFPFTDDLSGALDPLSNTGCNAHLVGMFLDATVAAVIPELLAQEDDSVSPDQAGELVAGDHGAALETSGEDGAHPVGFL